MPKLRPLCGHVFADGRCCGSPRLRDSQFCYWHNSARVRRAKRTCGLAVPPEKSTIHMPFIEDADSLMVSLQEVMQALAENRIDRARAGLILYAIQTSATVVPLLNRRPCLRNRVRVVGGNDRDDLTLPQEPPSSEQEQVQDVARSAGEGI